MGFVKEDVMKIVEQTKARIITLIESKFYGGLDVKEEVLLEDIIQNIKDLI